MSRGIAWASTKRRGDDVRVFYEDLSEYDYQDEDAFTDRESGFDALWYRPPCPAA